MDEQTGGAAHERLGGGPAIAGSGPMGWKAQQSPCCRQARGGVEAGPASVTVAARLSSSTAETTATGSIAITLATRSRGRDGGLDTRCQALYTM